MYSINIVGTPYRAVALCVSTASMLLVPLKTKFGNKTADPNVKAARLPITIPKQWYNGTGRHIISLEFKLSLLPMK
jgi:hypothetical protein